MKILFSYTLAGRGGDAVQILDMEEALNTLGHKVVLFGPNRLQPYEFSSNSGHLRNLARRLPWWCKDFIDLGLQVILILKARRVINSFKPDIVFHRAGIYDFAAVSLARAGRCPLVVHLDAPFPAERAFRKEGYFSPIHRYCMKKLGREAIVISTISQDSLNYYVKLGLSKEKIIVQYNGVTRHLLTQGKELSYQKLPFSKGPPFVVGFVGSLSHWHGVDTLLESLRLLNSTNPGICRLAIVGYGEEYAHLRALEKELNLGPQIDWLGPLSHEKAFEQIAQMDIAILPNTLPTGAPMKLFEYAALARPIIAPNLPNLRDIFSENEICFVQKSNPELIADAIVKLVKEPESARDLGKRAQAHVEQFCWETIISRLLSLLPGHKNVM